MSQRLYMDYDRCSYQPQPFSNRDKTSKMAEIQNYVNVLIDNNRAYADQLNTLRRQNTDLRGQIEVIMGDIIRQKQKNEELLTSTKAEYSKQVGKLIDQLKDILNKKQQMQGSYKALLEELSYQSQFDKRARGIQLEQIQRNYQNKIKILNDRITEQNKQIQKNYYLQSDNKLRMVKQIDDLNYEVCELRKENNDLRQAHSFDQNQMARLSASIKLLSKEKEEIGVNLLKIQQQKNHHIIGMKQVMGQLREELNDQIDNVKKLQISLLTKQKEYQQLSQRRDIQLRDKSQSQNHNIKLSHEVNDKSNQIANLTNQLSRLSEYSNRELKRMSQLTRVLENDNSKMSKQRQELETQMHIKQEQVYSLLSKVQCLQTENATANTTIMKIQQDNLQLKRENVLLKDELDSLMLQLRNQREKCLLQGNHISTLQQMIEKQKKKNMYLETTNINNQIASKQIPNQLNRKYEQQIQDILRSCDYQKSQIAQKFQLQKQKLIRMYEKALRQKQSHFKQKIFLMESEIRELANS